MASLLPHAPSTHLCEWGSTHRRCGLVQKCRLGHRRCPTSPWRSRSRKPPRPPECKACTWSWSGGRWPLETSPRRWRNPARKQAILNVLEDGNYSEEARQIYLQPGSNSLHALPVPRVALGNNSHLHQQSNEHSLPAKVHHVWGAHKPGGPCVAWFTLARAEVTRKRRRPPFWRKGICPRVWLDPVPPSESCRTAPGSTWQTRSKRKVIPLLRW